MTTTISRPWPARVVDGVARWESNGQVPPADVVERWAAEGHPVDPRACAVARDADLDAFLRSRRDAADRMTPAQRAEVEAEAAAERRAAFGPGVDVVDVVTGRRYRT